MSTRVLVVDDDPQILRALRINLTAHGYQVLLAPDGGAALRAAADGHPDVVVLDLGLPDMDGTEVIEGLRGWTTVPIIVLSARTGVAAHGARPRRRRRRLRHQAVRHGRAARPAARRGAPGRRRDASTASRSSTPATSASTSPPRRCIRADGTEVHLTPDRVGRAGAARAPPRQARRADASCCARCGGPNYGTETNYLRVYLAQLRRKLEPEPAQPKHLITEAGMGYRFEAVARRLAGRSPASSTSPSAVSPRRSS